jgi:hypothetical protein
LIDLIDYIKRSDDLGILGTSGSPRNAFNFTHEGQKERPVETVPKPAAGLASAYTDVKTSLSRSEEYDRRAYV